MPLKTLCRHVCGGLQDQKDEVTSKREALTLAHYIFWNVIPDYRGCMHPYTCHAMHCFLSFPDVQRAQ